MDIEMEKLDERNLSTLYEDYQYTDKEIGLIFGLTESAVEKRRNTYHISTLSPNSRKRNKDVNIIYTGVNKKLRDNLTMDVLKNLFIVKGMTDDQIGSLFELSGTSVRNRRKKYNLEADVKKTKNNVAQDMLRNTPYDVLNKDYYSLNYSEFSKKYSLSKTVWLPYLRSIGIQDKYTSRINKYPPLTKDQRSLIIGSLLGDGGISEGSIFYESHSLTQKKYS